SLRDNIKTYAVGSVWIGKVTGSKYLLWFYGAQQGHGLLYILFVGGFFRKLSTVIEWQVLEMDVAIGEADKAGASGCFTFAYQGLDRSDDFGISMAGLFGLEEMDGFLIDFVCYAVVTIDRRVKILYKLEIPPHVVIPYGCIARGLIGDVHVVALVHQVDKRAAH